MNRIDPLLRLENSGFSGIVVDIKRALASATDESKTRLFANLTEPEFIESRVYLYVEQVEKAVKDGSDLPNAEAIAKLKCLEGIEEGEKSLSPQRTVL
jgi:hypothetical protein